VYRLAIANLIGIVAMGVKGATWLEHWNSIALIELVAHQIKKKTCNVVQMGE